MPTKRKHPNRVSLRPNGKFKRVCGKSSGKDAQFYLDTKDKAEAQRRSLCLHQFWDKKIQNGESDWGQDLEHARSIAQSGHIEIPFNASDSDTPKAHLKYLEEIAKQQSRFEHLQVRVVPSNTDIYELGRQKAAKDVQEHIQKAKQLGLLADLPPSTYSNQTLHQALESFINWVKKEHRDRDFPERGRGNGEQIIKRSLMIKRATPDYPLEQFNLKAIDKIARYFKSRPQTTWNTQMAISSVENAIKTLRRFDLPAHSFYFTLPVTQLFLIIIFNIKYKRFSASIILFNYIFIDNIKIHYHIIITVSRIKTLIETAKFVIKIVVTKNLTFFILAQTVCVF